MSIFFFSASASSSFSLSRLLSLCRSLARKTQKPPSPKKTRTYRVPPVVVQVQLRDHGSGVQTRLLHDQLHVDRLVGLQAEHELVPEAVGGRGRQRALLLRLGCGSGSEPRGGATLLGTYLRGERRSDLGGVGQQRPRGRLELEPHDHDALVQGLAGLDDERHARPALVVDEQGDGGKRRRLGVCWHSRVVGVALWLGAGSGVLSQDDVLEPGRGDAPQEFDLFVADIVGRERDGLLHRQQGEDLFLFSIGLFCFRKREKKKEPRRGEGGSER